MSTSDNSSSQTQSVAEPELCLHCGAPVPPLAVGEVSPCGHYVQTDQPHPALARDMRHDPRGLAQLEAGDFQAQVGDWLARVTAGDPTDLLERIHRAVEEVAEFAQAGGVTLEDWGQLGARTFARPKGELPLEMGGVMLTVASVAVVAGLDAVALGEAELRRVNTPEMMAKVRAKRATRAGRGPLPGVDPDFVPSPCSEER